MADETIEDIFTDEDAEVITKFSGLGGERLRTLFRLHRQALAAPEHRDALVAWLVEAGVLVHDGWRYPKAYWSDDEGGWLVRCWPADPDEAEQIEDQRPDNAVPQYTIGGSDG